MTVFSITCPGPTPPDRLITCPGPTPPDRLITCPGPTPSDGPVRWIPRQMEVLGE